MEIQSLAWAVFEDETTQGGRCFVVKDLDHDGCMGQGRTPEEATANWVSAREELLGDR